MNSLLTRVASLVTSVLIASFVQATTFTVTNANNAGGGSLRDAIIASNADISATAALPHNIQFAIAGAGVKTIAPTSQFPFITRPVVIDGYSQTGSSANSLAVGDNSVHLIELDGSNANAANGLFRFDGGSGGSILRGLVINRCVPSGFGAAFAIVVTTGNVTLEGSFIGTNAAGAVGLGGAAITISNGGALDPGAVIIGGSLPAQRNVVSGPGSTGIAVSNRVGVQIIGNYIGTNAAGTAALGGQGIGISGTAGAAVLGPFTLGGLTATPGTGAGNVISGNTIRGISVDSDTFTPTGAGTIQGNIMGLTADGLTVLGGGGIVLRDNPFSAGATPTLAPVTIGGIPPSARNIISGNSGIAIRSVADGVTIQQNYIGTDITGTLARPNGGGVILSGRGLALSGLLSGSQIIGGIGAGNVIAGNSGFDAIVVERTTATIRGNRIGTRADGVTTLPNTGRGIDLYQAVAIIGGTTAGEGNTITGSGQEAIRVVFNAATNVGKATILGNSIYQNGPLSGLGGLGINLYPNLGDLVTPNDTGDADIGASGLQNYPVIASATAAGNLLGALNSVASSTFRVEFFANAACDGSGYGEGKTFIGFQTVTTDGSGNASFNATFAALPAGQSVVTATATDSTGNTSEFSQCVTASLPVALSVIKTGSGSGAVVTSPAGINCGALCSALFGAGSAVTLTATPSSAASIFTGWLGSSCTGSLTCALTINASATVTATFALASNGPFNLDVDGNAPVSAATAANDGVLILRYVMGMTGAALIGGGVVSADGTRQTPAALLSYLDDLKPKLDVDGNGQVDALTDGLLISRYLLGIRGPALITGALGVNPLRTTFMQIENHLAGLLPP